MGQDLQSEKCWRSILSEALFVPKSLKESHLNFEICFVKILYNSKSSLTGIIKSKCILYLNVIIQRIYSS